MCPVHVGMFSSLRIFSIQIGDWMQPLNPNGDQVTDLRPS